MIIAMWITLAVIVYFAGFTVTAALEERSCKHGAAGHVYWDSWGDKTTCGHPWASPMPIAWPIVLAMMICGAPFWFAFGGAGKLSHKLATLPTREERQAVRAAEKDERHQKMAARILELETELGVKHE